MTEVWSHVHHWWTVLFHLWVKIDVHVMFHLCVMTDVHLMFHLCVKTGVHVMFHLCFMTDVHAMLFHHWVWSWMVMPSGWADFGVIAFDGLFAGPEAVLPNVPWE